MLIQQHNLKNILFAIKCMIDSHQCIIKENGFKSKHEEIEHAAYILEKIHQYNEKAFEMLRSLKGFTTVSDEIMASGADEGSTITFGL